MLKKILLGATCLLAASAAWAEEECQNLVTYQVCWPESEFLIFAGIHDGLAVFPLRDGGIGRTANLGSDYASPDALREAYLSEAVFHEGTFEMIDDHLGDDIQTFTISAVGNSQLNQPRNPRLGIPIIVSIVPMNGDYILVDTVFPNPFQLPQNAVWNADRLTIHEEFASKVRPLE